MHLLVREVPANRLAAGYRPPVRVETAGGSPPLNSRTQLQAAIEFASNHFASNFAQTFNYALLRFCLMPVFSMTLLQQNIDSARARQVKPLLF